MGLTVDYFNSIVGVTSPTTDVDMQVLHDFIEDQMASPVGMGIPDILQPEGKIEDPSQPGVFSQIIIILASPWQIQFWQGSGYTRIFGGKLVGGLGDEPMKATGLAGDITVLESPVDGLTVVSGSGVTAGDKTDIIDGVWQKALESGLTAEQITRIMLAALAGKTAGVGTLNELYKAQDGAKTRIDVTFDAENNRTIIVLDGS